MTGIKYPASTGDTCKNAWVLPRCTGRRVVYCRRPA